MTELATVPVMFTDLVGSTGMASRVGPAAAEELRREHFTILRDAIAESGGTEVKNLGDGLMVVFESVATGIGCAVSIQQRIERRNRRAEEQLGVRIGLSLGDADRDGDDYFGPPVVEAARLCAKAAGGKILTGEMVRMMAGGRGNHRFESVGTLELKGLPEPFPTFEIAWEPVGAEAAVPLPPRLREIPPVGYVGRAVEREGLAYLWSESRSGSRRVALISGEPGIGKTRLATHLALQAHGEGATVLYGRCDGDVGVPYQPWVEALQHFVDAGSEEVLTAHVDRHGGEIARLAPQIAQRVDDLPAPRESDADTARYLLFGAAVGLLEQASADEPVVLILDDLHWADKPTLLLLKHLVASAGEMSLLVLGTYRDSELSRDHPLSEVLADLRREEGTTRVSLSGLTEDDVVDLMETAAGHKLDESGIALAREVANETDGNPFFVAELLRHLVDTGAIAQGDDGRWRLSGTLAELGLPESVREVVGRRVDALGDDVRRVLSGAAVIGRDFDVELLGAVVDTGEDELLDLLEEAVSASVLDEAAMTPGRFTFAHALINHTLYDDLGATRRARLHARVAKGLEALCGDDPGPHLAELANHWSLATQPVDTSKALDYSRRAGERALAELAPDEALRWLGRTLDLLDAASSDEPRTRCDVLTGLGEAQRQTGQAEYRETLLEAAVLAEQLGDAERMGRAALANNRGWTSQFGEVDRERISILERAIELDGLADPARCARLISLQAMELQFDLDHVQRRALADEALALAREVGDEAILAAVMWEWFQAHWAPDTLEARRAITDELTRLAERLEDPLAEVWAVVSTLYCAAEVGDTEVAEATAARFRAVAESVGHLGLLWQVSYHEAGLALVRGDLDAAETLADSAAQLGGELGQPDALVVYAGQISEVRWLQGRLDEVIDLLEQSAADTTAIPGFRAGLAAALGRLGRIDEAAAIVKEGARDGFAHVPRDQVYLTTLVLYAEGASGAGDREAAEMLYDLIEPWGEQTVWNGAMGWGPAHGYLGLLASTLNRDERADAHFAASSKRAEGGGMPIWAAKSHADWARALAQRGEANRARIEAERALELATPNGYGFVERDARVVLDSLESAFR